jgi:hypothetical protein
MSASDDREDDRHDEIEADDERSPDRGTRFDGEIPRLETAHRIGLTVLFAIVSSVLRTVLGAIVIFELLFALITRREPSWRVRELANQIIAYHYRLLRYLTYNESRVPFPFSDFPEPLEPDEFRPEDRDSGVLDADR